MLAVPGLAWPPAVHARRTGPCTHPRTPHAPLRRPTRPHAAPCASPPPPGPRRSHWQSREEEYVGGLRAALGVWGKMRDEGYTMDDGLMMRQLLDWPGGLELHIGVGRGAGAGRGASFGLAAQRRWD